MYPQVRSVETPEERNLRIVREQESLYPETVIALLQPFEQQTAAGMMPFANMGGETVPLASAVRRLRDGSGRGRAIPRWRQARRSA